ncbi:MAG: hypothetical protein ACP5R5_13810 [Armatimonadota bacterium]
MGLKYMFRSPLLLDVVCWFFILLGCAVVLVDQLTYSDVRVQLFSWTWYGISLVAAGTCVLLRIPAGWWWLAANAVLVPVVAVYASVLYAPYPERRPSGMSWLTAILCLMLVASSVVLAVHNPWRWRNDRGTRGSEGRAES